VGEREQITKRQENSEQLKRLQESFEPPCSKACRPDERVHNQEGKQAIVSTNCRYMQTRYGYGE